MSGEIKLKKRLMLSFIACFLILSACKEEEAQEPQIQEPQIEDVDDLIESQETQAITEPFVGPLLPEDYDKLWPDAKNLSGLSVKEQSSM